MNPSQLLIQAITDRVQSSGPGRLGVAVVRNGNDCSHFVVNSRGQVVVVGVGSGLVSGLVDERCAKPVLNHSSFSRIIEAATPVSQWESALFAALKNLRLPHLAHIHEQLVEGRERPPAAGIFLASELSPRLSVNGAIRSEAWKTFAAGDWSNEEIVEEQASILREGDNKVFIDPKGDPARRTQEVLARRARP